MKQYDSAPDMQIDASTQYMATIKTAKGDILLSLDAANAPKTVNNFVFLARDGFYDGVGFHRIIPNFMAQGGDPTGSGRGGPGYRFEDETKGNPNVHDRGVISMANAGPNTNGSQFFIVYQPQPHLNGKHTVFGRVTDGMEVVDALSNGDTMESVTISEG